MKILFILKTQRLCHAQRWELNPAIKNVLDQLNKGIDLPTASTVFKTLKKTGIATYCYFLFGTPPETQGMRDQDSGFRFVSIMITLIF